MAVMQRTVVSARTAPGVLLQPQRQSLLVLKLFTPRSVATASSAEHALPAPTFKTVPHSASWGQHCAEQQIALSRNDIMTGLALPEAPETNLHGHSMDAGSWADALFVWIERLRVQLLAAVQACLQALGLVKMEQPAQDALHASSAAVVIITAAPAPVHTTTSASVSTTSEQEQQQQVGTAVTPTNTSRPVSLVTSYASIARERVVCVAQAVQSLPPCQAVAALSPLHRLGLGVAVLLAVAGPAWVVSSRRAAERKAAEAVQLERNAASLRAQKQRFAAALAYDSVAVELPPIRAADIDPNELPTTPMSGLLAQEELEALEESAAAASGAGELGGEMRREYERFMAVSKIAMVRDLWDARRAAEENAAGDGAPRASRAQLEEMTRRVRDANKGHEGDKKDYVGFDDLYGVPLRDKNGGVYHSSSTGGDGEVDPTIAAFNASYDPADMAERAAARRARNAAALKQSDAVLKELGAMGISPGGGRGEEQQQQQHRGRRQEPRAAGGRVAPRAAEVDSLLGAGRGQGWGRARAAASSAPDEDDEEDVQPLAPRYTQAGGRGGSREVSQAASQMDVGPVVSSAEEEQEQEEVAQAVGAGDGEVGLSEELRAAADSDQAAVVAAVSAPAGPTAPAPSANTTTGEEVAGAHEAAAPVSRAGGFLARLMRRPTAGSR